MTIAMSENQNNADVVFNTITQGHVEVDCAGGINVTLSNPDQARYAQINCTGLLTANIDLIVPAEAKIYIIRNNTTGAYTLTVKVSGGTGVAVTQTEAWQLGCDATEVYRVE